jgi:hypothetical protein
MNEYQLTPDEKELIAATVLYHQQQVLAEVNAILRAIARSRKLDGNWTLEGDKLILGA